MVHSLLSQLGREGDKDVAAFLDKRGGEFNLKLERAAEYASAGRWAGKVGIPAQTCQKIC
jgi:hypothetical protein